MTSFDEPLHLETEFPDSKPSLSGHIWKQRGPWLVCVTCPREHGISVTAYDAQPTDLFQGLDKNGKPRFKRL